MGKSKNFKGKRSRKQLKKECVSKICDVFLWYKKIEKFNKERTSPVIYVIPRCRKSIPENFGNAYIFAQAYLIDNVDYSIIVATLLIVWHTVVFIVFLVRFYTNFYYSLYYLYVFLKIIKCILSAWVSWFLTFKYQIFNLDFQIIFFPVIYKYY